MFQDWLKAESALFACFILEPQASCFPAKTVFRHIRAIYGNINIYRELDIMIIRLPVKNLYTLVKIFDKN